ncbi:hypothetical protein FB451DRAFT_1184891 [Mycena latifolia]|nr:hypothetical protein FB451DRAFT_1184891 [Mycena latifolia]
MHLRALASVAVAWFGVFVAAIPAGISASVVFDVRGVLSGSTKALTYACTQRTHSPTANLLTCGKSCVFSWYTCTGDCAFCHPTLANSASNGTTEIRRRRESDKVFEGGAREMRLDGGYTSCNSTSHVSLVTL